MLNSYELSILLKRISSIEGGTGVAIEILSMRLHGFRDKSYEPTTVLVNTAREVVSNHIFLDENHQNSISYNIEIVINACLPGADAVNATELLCKNIDTAISEGYIFAFDYFDVLSALAKVQSVVFLDVFIEGSRIHEHRRNRIFSDDLNINDNPLDQISDDNILKWCELDVEIRYPLIISELPLFFKSDETEKLTWKPIVYLILMKTVSLESVLKKLEKVKRPWSRSGSLVVILQERLALFKNLTKHKNTVVSDWAKKQCIEIQENITRYQEQDYQLGNSRNECFE